MERRYLDVRDVDGIGAQKLELQKSELQKSELQKSELQKSRERLYEKDDTGWCAGHKKNHIF